MREYPSITITQEMIDSARALSGEVRVDRTKASPMDAIAGILGEYVFAQWLTGDWKNSEVGQNKGQVDFKGLVEVKASVYPFRDTLNLLIREDYAEKRQPDFYVQIIIDTAEPKITAGMKAILGGFISSKDIKYVPSKDFGSKFGGAAGYKCKYVPLFNLNSMDKFQQAYLKAETAAK